MHPGLVAIEGVGVDTVLNWSNLLSCHLQGLTQVEEMLVSAVMPIMSVYRLP